MEIFNVEIDWKEGVMNSPVITLVVDELPKFDPEAPIWNKESTGVVWAENGHGVISYIVYKPSDKSNPQWNGFGGSEFTRILKDGTVLKSNNWWSGGAYGLTSFGIDCAEVRFKVGGSRTAGFGFAMRIERLRDVLNEFGVQGYMKKVPLGEWMDWELIKNED